MTVAIIALSVAVILLGWLCVRLARPDKRLRVEHGDPLSEALRRAVEQAKETDNE